MIIMPDSGTTKISDNEIARLRSKLGQVMTVSESPYLTMATSDSIRRWAMATGDRNPLYFAEAGSDDQPEVPPCMLYAFSRLAIGYRGGFPGVHSMFGGSHWRWYDTLRAGVPVTAETRFDDLIELHGKFAGRMFRQVSLTTFHLPGQSAPAAEVQGWGMRVERQAARNREKYQPPQNPGYTAADLRRIGEEYSTEFVRGATLLHCEDVRPGERIPSVVRGPYTATTAIAFEQAWGGLFIRAHGYWFDLLRDHPALGISNSYGIPEPPEAVHWDSQLARSVGVPEAYDYGPERIAWIATMLTNWIGNDGFLEELYCEVRRFNLIGDLTHCHAQVTEIQCDPSASYGRVRLRVWADNQRNETTAQGWAWVRLPSRPGPVTSDGRSQAPSVTTTRSL